MHEGSIQIFSANCVPGYGHPMVLCGATRVSFGFDLIGECHIFVGDHGKSFYSKRAKIHQTEYKIQEISLTPELLTSLTARLAEECLNEQLHTVKRDNQGYSYKLEAATVEELALVWLQGNYVSHFAWLGEHTEIPAIRALISQLRGWDQVRVIDIAPDSI